MTVLDTFYLLFKTDIPKEAGADIAKLDKQIDELTKKGKKRSDDENKQYAILKKHRKEFLDETKRQQKETEKLKDSFTGMIDSAVGAITAYASFSFLKEGLKDANRLNASLTVLGKITQTNAGEIKKWGQALALSGGNAEDMYAFVYAEGNEAAKARVPFNLKRLLENLHNQVKNDPQFLTKLQQVPGATALAPLLLLPDKEFNEKLSQADQQVELSKKDQDAALQNQEAAAKLKASFQSIATEIDTHLLEVIQGLTDALNGLLDTFRGHPVAAEAAGTASAVATGYFGWKLRSWLRGLFGSGEAATTATAVSEAPATVPAAALLGIEGAAVGATWGAGWLGDYIGRKLRKAPPSSEASTSNKQASIDFWISQGYTPAQATAWAANEQAESGFNSAATNGSHSGIFQWSAIRRAKILAATGIDVMTAGHADQLRAAAWEARNMGLGPLALPTDPEAAAAAISNRFEVPSLTSAGLIAEAQKRASIANGIYSQIPYVTTNGGTTSKSTTIKIGDIIVNTQATDATGIAQAVSAELKNQLRMLASNVDDGEFA